MFRYMVMFCLAIVWSIIYLSFSGFVLDIFILFALSSALGIVIYALYLSILKNRFELPIPDQSFSQLANSALDKTHTTDRVSVWMRLDDEPYIASTYNSSFEAVIVSSKMMEMMLAMPESGEAVLAFHLLRMPERKSILDIVAGIFIFVFSSIFMAYVLGSLLILSYSIYFIFLIMSSVGLVYASPIFLIILLRGAFWTHEKAFALTQSLYKIHPQVAKDEVISARVIDEELANSTIWSVKRWEESKRNSRRASISVLVTIVLYAILFLVLYTNPIGYLYVPLELTVSILLLPIVGGALTFLLIRRWDRNCLGELYYDVSESHEPIWLD